MCAINADSAKVAKHVASLSPTDRCDTIDAAAWHNVAISINDIEQRMLGEDGGELNIKDQHALEMIRKKDGNSDGAISVAELVQVARYMARKKEKTHNMKILMAIGVVAFVLLSVALFAVTYAANEVTKEVR